MRISDWSSDVCSSDLLFLGARPVYRSADGGKTWSRVDGIPKSEELANITAIAIDPKNPQTMYATGHGIGVVKSVDGGASWTTKEKGLGSASTEALAIDGREPNRLYVWVLGDGSSDEHTSELQSLMRKSYAVFCLKKKKYIRQ